MTVFVFSVCTLAGFLGLCNLIQTPLLPDSDCGLGGLASGLRKIYQLGICQSASNQGIISRYLSGHERLKSTQKADNYAGA